MRRRREAGPDLFTLKCEECGQYLVRTESGYLACPQGHGALQVYDGSTFTQAPEPEPDPADLWARAELPD